MEPTGPHASGLQVLTVLCDPPSPRAARAPRGPPVPRARPPQGSRCTLRENLPRRQCLCVMGGACHTGRAHRTPDSGSHRVTHWNGGGSTCPGHTSSRPAGPFLLEQQDNGGAHATARC